MIVRQQMGPSDEIGRESVQVRQSLSEHPWVAEMLDSLTEMTLVLDARRRIIFANRPLLDKLGIDDATVELYGKRIGDCLSCVNADELGGCGETEACNTCGANLAVMSAIDGRRDRRECRIRSDAEEVAFDFLVTTTPVVLGGDRFVFCSLTDISAEKRRDLLERTFFHDVLNTAGVVSGYTRLLTVLDAERARPFAAKTYAATSALIDEIKAQRDLRSAESGELEVALSEVESMAFLQGVVEAWAQHEVAQGRSLVIAEGAESVLLRTDRVLLGRVISNMVKNALESTAEGGTVTVGCKARGREAVLSVHNPAVMPAEAQLQIFQRSFTTKGKGRGIGTYSMKLLTERYLHGRVGFTSSAGDGTTFTATLPLGVET